MLPAWFAQKLQAASDSFVSYEVEDVPRLIVQAAEEFRVFHREAGRSTASHGVPLDGPAVVRSDRLVCRINCEGPGNTRTPPQDKPSR